ncbi:MAG TPA: alpha/beta hydrolase [Microthrixaceae bacterium]|nr:alpha/beta hydrolase [Microthrixaceae bacterium]
MNPRRVAPAMALVIAVLAVSCSVVDTDTSSASLRSEERTAARAKQDVSPQPDGKLSWTGCQDKVAAAARLQCATLEVPLDPSEPNGKQISLALARQKATGTSEQRLGSLVMNPGGPGGSGIEFLASAAAIFPAELSQRFDLVSFDPRGVAESSPVRCLDDKAKAEQLTGDLSPDTPEELKRAVDDQKTFLEGCKKKSGDLLTHMSTADVAADLDLIREALGDKKLSYVGFSYGTAIGAVYATLFPENTRALVLDGSVSPTSDPVTQTEIQVKGFENTLKNFISACNADKKCAIGPDAAAVIQQTRAALAKKPIKVTDSTGTRELGVDLFDLGLATALYDTTLWGTVATSISTINEGGAELLLSLGDRQTGRKADGTFNNSSDSQTMVNCADENVRPSLSEAQANAERIKAAAPTFGDALAWSALGCLDWPEAANPLPTISGAGAAPILVIGTLGDPATPYTWSEEMASTLESGHLLTYEGDGHTAFLRAGPCIDDAVVSYLVDLKLPVEGKSCPTSKKSINFTGLSDEVVRQLVDAGLPKDLAQCVIDGLIKQVGLAEFNRIVLEQDTDALSKLVTAQTLSCVSGKN